MSAQQFQKIMQKIYLFFTSLCVIGWNHIISIFSIWRKTYQGRTTSNVVVDVDIHATLTKKMPQNCINLTFIKNRMIWGWHLAHEMHVQYMFIKLKDTKKLWQTGYHSYTREDMFSRVWPWSKQKTTVSECSTYIKYFCKLKLFLFVKNSCSSKRSNASTTIFNHELLPC